MKNKIMFLIAALIGFNASVVMGTEKPEAGAFERAVCKKMESMFAYNKGSIDQHELNVFLKGNGIASTDELIAILEQGKELLNQDIVAEKTANKSIWPYLAGFFAVLVPSIGGILGFGHEQDMFATAQSKLWNYDFGAADVKHDIELMKPYFVNGKPDWNQIRDAMVGNKDYALRGTILNLIGSDSSWNTPSHNAFFTQEAENKFDRIGKYLDNAGNFDIGRYNLFHPKPAEYTMQNMFLYKSLIAAGVIALPLIAYKLYGYYKFERNKEKEIMTLEAIIEQVKAVQ